MQPTPQTYPSLPLNSPSYIHPTTFYFPSPFNVYRALVHPLFVANLFHITHNKQNFLPKLTSLLQAVITTTTKQ